MEIQTGIVRMETSIMNGESWYSKHEEILLPILILVGLSLLIVLCPANEITRQDNNIMSIKCFLFGLIMLLIVLGKHKTNRMYHLLTIPVVLLLLWIGTDNEYQMKSQPDTISNQAHAGMLKTSYGKHEIVFWDSYKFSGMPTCATPGNEFSQIMGMKPFISMWNYYSICFISLLLLYYLFRLKPSKIEINIKRKIINWKNQHDPIDLICTVIVLWLAIPYEFACVYGLIVFHRMGW